MQNSMIENPFVKLDKLCEDVQWIRENLLENKLANPPPPPPEIIDRKELCTRLKISEPTAIHWEYMEKIPFIVLGNKLIRYNWPKVVKALEAAKHVPRALKKPKTKPANDTKDNSSIDSKDSIDFLRHSKYKVDLKNNGARKKFK